MTVTRDAFWEAVRTECSEMDAKASQYDRCRASLSELTQYRDELHGQITVYQQQEAKCLDTVRAEAVLRKELDDRWGWPTWLGVAVGALVVGFGAGVIIGI
jgi:hypothetical protein